MKRPMLQELKDLIAASLAGSRIGYTTTIGNAGGTTFTDATLIGAGANSFISMSVVIAPDDILAIDRAEISAFNNATGEFSLETAYKGGQIPLGTQYALIPTGADLGPLTILVEAIKVVTDAMLVESETGGILTTTAAAQDLFRIETPAGVFAPRLLKLDFTNHLIGDTVVVNCYERIIAGGGMLQWDTLPFAGLINPVLRYIDLPRNRFGIQITIISTVGAFHDYTWEVMLAV